MTASSVLTTDLVRGLWVGGNHVSGAGEFPVEDPATGETIAVVADGDSTSAAAAARAAAAALPGWAAAAPRKRSEVLAAAHSLMMGRAEQLSVLISRENGKCRADALAEVAYAAEFFRWYAEESVRTHGQYGVAPDGGARTIVTQQPVGVAALVTPWNFPAAMVTRKLAPALAAGCTTLLKPATETPLTAFAIAELLAEAGTPDGTVNVVTTTRPGEVVSTWLALDAVRKLSFTGSTKVGRMLLAQAATRVVNCSMELGGNAPFVVCADADVDAAVAGAVVAKLRNTGQACTAANRFLVHQAVAEEFTAKLAAAFATRRVGPWTDPTNDTGPLISARKVRELRRLIGDAIAAGASVANIPAEVPDRGHFFAPLVLADVTPDSPLMSDEIFGPIAPISTYHDTDAMVAAANTTEYGLAGYVYSRDLNAAIEIGQRLNCGMIGVNRGVVSDPSVPFGGMKQSGIGREGGSHGLHAFQEPQYLSLAW